MKLKACIVTFNNDYKVVAKTMETFFDQKIDNKELTIVDNNSTNGILDNLKKIYPQVKYINSGVNNGFGYGHNIAIKLADECEYYLVLNPDVEIHNDTLKVLIDYLDTNKDVGLICPKILNPDGTIQYLCKRRPTFFDLFARRFLPSFIKKLSFIKNRMDYYIMMDKGYDNQFEVPYLSGCFMLFRNKILQDLKGFDDNFFMYLEDADITYRTSKISKAVYYPKATITHQWARGSHRSLKLTWITIQSSFYYFKKWGFKFI